MKKILLIDDSDTYIWNLRKYLQRLGYPVKTASTLNEARAAIQEEMPLVVCCDLDLPDGTAMELFHTLRRVAGILPFFILTKNNDLATEYEYRHEGVNDYITAPVNIPELIRRILFFVE